MYAILHRIDCVEKDQRAAVIEGFKKNCSDFGILPEHCFATSLFDGSLTRAFSTIVSTLLPRFDRLENVVKSLANAFKQSRVMILDAATFLPVCDSDPEKIDQPQPIFDFFLRLYPRNNPMKTLMFECTTGVVVYTKLSKTTGIFVSTTEPTVPGDAVMFNIRRAIPVLKEFVSLSN
jgi:hypothetical protein